MAEKSAKLKKLQVTNNNGGPAGKKGPTVSKADAFTRDYEKLKLKYGKDYVISELRTKRGGADAFPVEFYPHDRDDTIAEIKVEAPAEYGVKEFTDWDAKYLLRKQQAQNLASYKQFLMSNFDMTNPAEAELANRIAPEILEEKIAIIRNRADLDAQLAKINLRGYPNSAEDFQLLYLLKSGGIELPDGTLWMPETWGCKTMVAGGYKKGTTTPLNRGFWSPMNVPKDVSWDKANAPFNMVVPGTPTENILPRNPKLGLGNGTTSGGTKSKLSIF